MDKMTMLVMAATRQDLLKCRPLSKQAGKTAAMMLDIGMWVTIHRDEIMSALVEMGPKGIAIGDRLMEVVNSPEYQ